MSAKPGVIVKEKFQPPERFRVLSSVRLKTSSFSGHNSTLHENAETREAMWGGATGSKGFGLFRETQPRRAAEWRVAFQEQETGGREAPVESGGAAVRTQPAGLELPPQRGVKGSLFFRIVCALERESCP